jgi:hypothetical protein
MGQGEVVSECLTAQPYTIYVFDCPYCGGRTEIGDVEPDDSEECDDCGATVGMDS